MEVDLNLMRDQIEKMSKYNQVEVLRILSQNKNVVLNENKYGIHVNLTDLDEEIIEQLVTYVNYINVQEMSLKEDEKQKEDFKNKYF
jgi:hypothetical protein